MIPFVLVTPRLRLVTITPEMMSADEARSTHLSTLLSAEIPDIWPPEHWEPHVFSFMREQFLHYPHTVGWNRYVVLKRLRPTLIGNVCAFPRSKSEAEIGYAILGPWQRRGLATEGVLAFTKELFRLPSLRSITAQTFPNLTSSIGVLRKCGFQLIGPGEEEGAVRYRLQKHRVRTRSLGV